MQTNQSPGSGALIISLDFELYWGIRDFHPGDGGSYRENLIGARTVVPKILSLFSRYDIAATWATVGMLMAASSRELSMFLPTRLPMYRNESLSPYGEIGKLLKDETDPIRFSRDVVELVRVAPRQEIGSHTFSHFYCLEEGQSPEAFRADIESAVSIAAAQGLPPIRSLVFPRNQFNPAYAQILASAGIWCCRTNARGWFNREMAGNRYFSPDVRISRLIDSYIPLSGAQTVQWSELRSISGVLCIPASLFVRPYTPRLSHLEALRLRRIVRGIEAAAKSGGIYHLWWHPENFGQNQSQNLDFLTRILGAFTLCRERYGMQSFAMKDLVAFCPSRTVTP